MSIILEKDITKPSLLRIAEEMIVAARTAPKGRGMDFLEMIVVEGDTIALLSDRMAEIGARLLTGQAFSRDALNIKLAEAIVLIGTRFGSLGLAYCSLCGFENCSAKELHPDKPCAFNTGDLGIAIGSAVSIAMDHRVDNRIMYTVGMAAKELALMAEEVKIIYGIPLSASSKNVFFDRK